MSTFTYTVLGGIIIFVIGQIFLRLVLEPTQELKKTLGNLCHLFLLHQAHLKNAISNNEISIEIKNKSAEIISKANTILMYNLVRFVFHLPSKENIYKASRELNLISYSITQASKDSGNSSTCNAPKANFALQNSNILDKIGRLLFIKTNYS
jgi:hypothetical protein